MAGVFPTSCFQSSLSGPGTIARLVYFTAAVEGLAVEVGHEWPSIIALTNEFKKGILRGQSNEFTA